VNGLEEHEEEAGRKKEVYGDGEDSTEALVSMLIELVFCH